MTSRFAPSIHSRPEASFARGRADRGWVELERSPAPISGGKAPALWLAFAILAVAGAAVLLSQGIFS